MFSNLVVRLGGLIGGIGNPSERTRGIDRYPKQTFMPMRQALTALHERVTPVMEPGADLVLQKARGTRSVPNPRGQLLGPRKERREKKKKEGKKGKKRGPSSTSVYLRSSSVGSGAYSASPVGFMAVSPRVAYLISPHISMISMQTRLLHSYRNGILSLDDVWNVTG